jgi:hypothetical protein
MAHIKKISFNSVGKNEGCVCDRCGQYIRNIWTVEYREGLTQNYGVDCWMKVLKEGLDKRGVSEIKKIMKSIENYQNNLSRYLNNELTAETDESYQIEQADWNKQSYWYGRSFEEYRTWLVEEFFPYRISEAQKRLNKYRKVNFEVT